MTLVNDRGYNLDTRCELGLFGKTCKVEDYRSWRRIVVAQRAAMIDGTYGDTPDLHKSVLYWLGRWVDTEDLGPLERGLAFGKSRSTADETDIPGARFPPTPSIWPETTYNDITDELAVYIHDGERIMKEAIDKGAVIETGEELEREPEDKSLRQQFAWILPVGLVAGGLALATWIYTSIRGAGRAPK